jgi:hypothetical protein
MNKARKKDGSYLVLLALPAVGGSVPHALGRMRLLVDFWSIPIMEICFPKDFLAEPLPDYLKKRSLEENRDTAPDQTMPCLRLRVLIASLNCEPSLGAIQRSRPITCQERGEARKFGKRRPAI